MLTYDFSSFPSDLGNWMDNRFLNPILNIEGGWEYWVQIDFPAWVDVYKKGQYDFRREVTPPNSSIRLDWLINGTTANPIAVNIKAQTHKYVTNKFVQDVVTDVNKLATLGSSYTKVMLAAVIDQSTHDSLIQAYSDFKVINSYDDSGNTVAFLQLES